MPVKIEVAAAGAILAAASTVGVRVARPVRLKLAAPLEEAVDGGGAAAGRLSQALGGSACTPMPAHYLEMLRLLHTPNVERHAASTAVDFAIHCGQPLKSPFSFFHGCR